jgi:hypothetical protein
MVGVLEPHVRIFNSIIYLLICTMQNDITAVIGIAECLVSCLIPTIQRHIEAVQALVLDIIQYTS